MKICAICKKQKSLDDFNKKTASKDGKQPHCRECSHERFKHYYHNNREKHYSVVRAKRLAVVELNRKKMLEYLNEHPCVDCSIEDVRVLEFDHVRGEKHNGVARLLASGCSWKTIQKEIDKCEVRCRNCHAIVTYERMGGSWHTLLAVQEAPL